MAKERKEKTELKDLFDIDKVIKEGHRKICIYAGVGAGKSTWVKDVLVHKGSVLFVTSRRATADQDLKRSSFKKYYNEHLINNQLLLTNAGLTTLVENISINGIEDLNDFIYSFDYIVIDEAHSIATDSTFADSSNGVKTFVEYAVKLNRNVVMMTGTPEPIEEYLKENNWHIIDYRDICRYVHPEAIYFTRNRYVVNKILKITENGQVIYFMNHVEDMIKLYKELISNPNIMVENIALMVAESRKTDLYKSIKNKCNEEIEKIVQEENSGNKLERKDLKEKIKEKIKFIKENDKSVYEKITSKNRIPDTCKIVLSTSTLREGINIFNNNITMFCDNHVLSNLIQFFGRVRIEGTKVYIVEDSNGHKVKPDEWLFNYAYREIETAKQHLKEYMETSFDNVDLTQEKYKVKAHLKKCNDYIYYDYIAGEFRVSELRYKEEHRIQENWNWIWRLQYHCSRYGIHCSPFTNKQAYINILPFTLKRLNLNKMKLFEEIRCNVINIINDAFDVDHKGISKLNEELKKQGFSYGFEAYTETKGERRGERYWEVVKIA